ncbi:hypothetical protein M885DRAFT_506040 [Pelagophyceae sp. CCMP2097]|nr:hypothetical protein M885DRAFT_506040 [Pelagophyceae sp. CCMP2097]
MRATTATAIGEASVVAHHAALTLVRCVEPRGAYGDILESVLVLVGAADGTASTWSLRRNSKGRWHRRANSSSLGRRPGVVFRGHGGSAVVAGDVNLALDVCVLAWQDGAVAVYSLGDGRLLRRLAVGGDEPRHVAISRQGVVVVGRLKPRSASSPAGGGGIVGATTLLEAHSVNGGVLARATVACDVKRLRVVGELSDAVLLVGAAAVELRALATLAPLRVLRLPIDSTLVDVDLAPDAQHPAALFVATSSGDVALRVLAGCEAWADRRAASDAGVGAFFTKRTSLAIGFAAAALGRGRDLATATSDVVGEARAFSKRGSAAASKPNVFSKAIGRLFAAQPQPPAPR